jgi:hypothetical protein
MKQPEEEKHMGSEKKATQLTHKVDFEKKLADRLQYLSDKGVEAGRIDKDSITRKFKSKIKEVNSRLRAIEAREKRTEELAKAKEAKAAAGAVKEKVVKDAAPEVKEPKKKKKKKSDEAAG